ncbi:hypothetical protein [Shewanella sp. GD03713]|uniref:hypothetical protein n=1 Tax=Shewanella TaxID=22 RepID=UPI00244D5414|nr:hypothetical protein [Shewanella sp. GD03713]MDH1472604.1 hypothetical protein [Shewanella sp. GD03713]
MQESETSEINIKGIITALAVEEFESDAALEEVLPQEVLSLFKSIVPEFGDSGLNFAVDGKHGVLKLLISDINADFCVVNINPFDGWDSETKTDYFVVRALLPDSSNYTSDVVMQMNKLHPHIKFYIEDGRVIVEEAYYLAYGIPVLNLMDRISAYLRTVNALVCK